MIDEVFRDVNFVHVAKYWSYIFIALTSIYILSIDIETQVNYELLTKRAGNMGNWI